MDDSSSFCLVIRPDGPLCFANVQSILENVRLPILVSKDHGWNRTDTSSFETLLKASISKRM